jgi:SAM-dependent methyltransferase
MPITYPFVAELLQKSVTVDSRVLEIGCGPMQYRPALNCRYEGLDLPTAPSLVEKPHWPEAAETMSCPSDSYDLVFGVAVFHLCRDVDAVLHQCHRVLKPGGRLIVFDYQRPVCERLSRTSPCEVWDRAALSARIAAAGFPARSIRDRSGYGVNMAPWRWANLVIGKGLEWIGRPDNWLILEARK